MYFCGVIVDFVVLLVVTLIEGMLLLCRVRDTLDHHLVQLNRPHQLKCQVG